MNKFLKYAAAAVIVLACSVEAKAQQGHSRAQTTQMYNTNRVYNNNTVYNNSVAYNGGGYGYRGGYYNNGVGNWPGSGPYDSAIAVTAIAAGASVVNNLINSTARPQVVYGQPQVVYAPAPQQVVVQPYQSNCRSYITGYSPSGYPVTVNTCN